MDRAQLLNDAEEAMRLVLDGRQSSMWTSLPGIVTAVDLVTNTVSVQPAIQGNVTDENGNVQLVNLPLLIHVPIVFPKAGGFIITFPIAIDDEVLVCFSSRCIDSWWQSSGIGKPMEARMHDLSDGFAIPGPSSVPNAVSGISATDLQIRNEDGDVFISIGADGKIKLVASAGVEITGDLKVSGDVIAGLVSLTTHTHPVTTAPGETGPPV